MYKSYSYRVTLRGGKETAVKYLELDLFDIALVDELGPSSVFEIYPEHLSRFVAMATKRIRRKLKVSQFKVEAVPVKQMWVEAA